MTRGNGITHADIHIRDAEGTLLLALEGFEQRIVRFPESIARRLFAGDRLAHPGVDDVEFLEGSWQIWARALAHAGLPPAELATWLAARTGRARALVDRLGEDPARRSVPE